MSQVAQRSLEAASLFEAEVLVQLLLWRWGHPLMDDPDFRNTLLENAADVLSQAVEGTQFIESVPPAEMNLIAAIWYAEWSSVPSEAEDPDSRRQKWLENVRRSMPSCFCSQDDLPGM